MPTFVIYIFRAVLVAFVGAVATAIIEKFDSNNHRNPFDDKNE